MTGLVLLALEYLTGCFYVFLYVSGMVGVFVIVP